MASIFCDARSCSSSFSRSVSACLRSVMSVITRWHTGALPSSCTTVACRCAQKCRAVYGHHPQLARLRPPPRPNGLFSEQVVDVLVFLKMNRGDRLLDQGVPGCAQQGGDGEVGLDEQILVTDGAITNRGLVVEVHVALSLGAQRRLRAAQLLVLHIQLDLMDPQLVQRHQNIFARRGLELFRRLPPWTSPTGDDGTP